MHKLVKPLVGPALVVTAVTAVGWLFRGTILSRGDVSDAVEAGRSAEPSESETLTLGPQARKNLKLVAKPAKTNDYWRSITIPGVVDDRPGVSDRGVTSPAVGAIAKIHVYPGDTVGAGERLVTLQLFSEYLQSTQTQLFQANQEISLLQERLNRLSDVASSGGIASSRLIDLRNDVRRQETLVKAARQELLTRGLTPTQIDRVADGEFTSSIDVLAPPPRTPAADEVTRQPNSVSRASDVLGDQRDDEIAYEIQSLAIELGQTVQAGQLIADLANHRSLYVVGHAFKQEAGFLEKAAQESRPVEIEFADENAEFWPPLGQTFEIRHLSNSIDRESRTFDFFIPLSNPSRTFEKLGETFLVWRFRPGQRARIHVPVEQMKDVFVLPAEAVVREGPAAYVYRQNGDLFDQIPVHVLHEDRRHVVIANDGSITQGTYLAQNAAASLRRVLKAQSARGEQPGLHVHADGTVHAAH